MKEPKLWGNLKVSVPPVQQTRVERVQGCLVEYGEDDKPKSLRIQYIGQAGAHDLVVPFLDGMFLLSLLKSIQLDERIPFPDDPRAPSARN